MNKDFISPDVLLEKLPLHVFAEAPLHLDPRFLLLSASYLKGNPHLLVRAGLKRSNIEIFYIPLKEGQKEWGFLPVLRVCHQKQIFDYIPAKSLERAILAPQGFQKEQTLNLQFELSDRGFNLQNLQTLTGWSLEGSLFSIFNWFHDEDRKRILDDRFDFSFELLDYSKGKKLLDHFYQIHLKNIKDFPAVMKRDQDLFQRIFPEKYRLILVMVKNQPIGVMNYLQHLRRIHLMEFIGNTDFKDYYAKILLAFFKKAKQENIQIIDTTKFEWCLLPFVYKILNTCPSDLSKFLKKAEQMKMRQLREVPE